MHEVILTCTPGFYWFDGGVLQAKITVRALTGMLKLC